MKQKIVRTDAKIGMLEGHLGDLSRLAEVVTVYDYDEENLARQVVDADIRGHCDCCSTCCPGKNFPWSELRRRIRR